MSNISFQKHDADPEPILTRSLDSLCVQDKTTRTASVAVAESSTIDNALSNHLLAAHEGDDEATSEASTCEGNRSTPTRPKGPAELCRHTIICDCSFGWPKQRRPRLERIRAVSNQLINFLAWRSEETRQRVGDSKPFKCHVVVFAEQKEDLKPLMDEFWKRCEATFGKGEVAILYLNASDNRCLTADEASANNEVFFLHGSFHDDLLPFLLLNLYEDDCPRGDDVCRSSSSLPQHLPPKSKHNEDTYVDAGLDVVYLSPDAEERINPRAPPPRVVVVGMLVDRRVTPNRSKDRAARVRCKCAHLPMSTLGVHVRDSEPLNIDACLELVQRWWLNYHDALDLKSSSSPLPTNPAKGVETAAVQIDGTRKHNLGLVDDELLAKIHMDAFLNAAAEAMMSHSKRHPNRSLHLT